jgi:8-oxo-dGTP diphosphatase
MTGGFVTRLKNLFSGCETGHDLLPPPSAIKIDISRSAPSPQRETTPDKYPDVVVGIVLRRRRAVMLRRTGEAGTMWTFPGGKVDEGETHEEAVVRELREEIGLICHVIRRIGERVHPVTGRTITYFLCKAEGGKSRNLERNKADDIRWLMPREIEAVTNGTLFDEVRETIASEARMKR